MKPKLYVILEQAVEEGVTRGYHKSHKHVENPTRETLIENITDYVMSSIHEYFTFEESDYV